MIAPGVNDDPTNQPSQHSMKRMRRRIIPQEAIDHVLTDWDDCVERDDNCRELTGTWEGRRILVVVSDDVEPPRVVTVVDLGRRSR